MGDYEGYISQLKGAVIKFDDGRMQDKIKSRLAGRSPKLRLALGGALLILLIGSLAYFIGRPYLPSVGNLEAYVFPQESLNSDLIMNYVMVD
jgi:hypothetical protein